MRTKDVLSKIRARRGVVGAFVMDTEMLTRVEDEESCIKATGGLVYENLGMERSRTMDTHVCVFSEGFITDPKGPLVVMMDADGTICGHNVPRSITLSSSAVRNGAVWISEDFVIYPDVIPRSEPRFVVLPHSVDFLGDATTSYNPAVSTDSLLKERFGFKGCRGLTTTIVSFNSDAQVL